jgi:DMSO reductase anchor subunit
MNPAPSIIVFTTASGAGYGLLAWLCLLWPLGLLPGGSGFTLLALALALALITGGLASSTFHLGRPERAWRALSQWRSSWLSREAVAAAATYVPAGLFGLAVLAGAERAAVPAALLAVAGAVATVWCTGMIYASLKPIREWHHPLVAPGYLLLALFTGALLLAMLAATRDAATAPVVVALLSGGAALLLKRRYWSEVELPLPGPTLETATGLGRIGATRPLDPPATERSWLMKEMGFRVARQHRQRLRRLSVAGFGAALLLAALALPAGPALATFALVLAVLAGGSAVLVERWLLFAEATHTVALFYEGNRSAA